MEDVNTLLYQVKNNNFKKQQKVFFIETDLDAFPVSQYLGDFPNFRRKHKNVCMKFTQH